MVNNEDNRRDEISVPETRAGVREKRSTSELTEYEDWRMEFVQWVHNRARSPLDYEGISSVEFTSQNRGCLREYINGGE
ncbi:hypothetical protein [Halogeometricum luteum]|uniref:Uncharacterized protein n=1 Tax=Halogeometricum luteum TaxID=2950537 RepID=A0ABU2G8H0_9EURY|nr:hypothetical protein [Halogeometricum sp. S3BR5-2]MDS0296548.1 hypothetical protein [Halogeometricum sp. S3BR5-2]